MGRFLSASPDSATATALTTATKVVPAGYMGEFGNGLWRVFQASGTFVVPPGVTRVRVRVVGAGAAGRQNGPGGGGGGYAHGVFNVTPGETHTVTVGDAGIKGNTPTSGGASSFGSLISATGGVVAPDITTPSEGGQGVGGDFQAKGGRSAGQYFGGGAAGSQLGDGGSSFGYGGAGVGGGDAHSKEGASPFGNSTTLAGAGPDITGAVAGSGSAGALNAISAVIRFPFDGFTGGGGSTSNSGAIVPNGGPGAGGGHNMFGSGSYSGHGGVGGGGGASNYNASSGASGTGGIGAGGGGSKFAANGGPGLVIVEW